MIGFLLFRLVCLLQQINAIIAASMSLKNSHKVKKMMEVRNQHQLAVMPNPVVRVPDITVSATDHILACSHCR